MAITLLGLKLLASAVLITSFAAFSQQTSPMSDEVPLSPQVQMVSTMSTSTIKKINKQPMGNCEKYRPIIESYNWPVDIAMEVCKYESQGNPKAIGDINTLYSSYGLFQIRSLPDRPSSESLIDPAYNVTYAYGLWQKEDFKPWSVCKTAVDCELPLDK